MALSNAIVLWTQELAMSLTHNHYIVITHQHPTISHFAANIHNSGAERQRAQHLVWDQGAEHSWPLVSNGLHSEANQGLPKGWLWLGDIWLSLVLRNPQPSPSAGGPGVQSLPATN